MKRTLERLRHFAASLPCAAGLLTVLLATSVAAQNYCNNPVPPCDPNDRSSPCYKPDDPPPKCEPKECDKCAKSPCYVGSGVYGFDASDLEIRTTGMPIKVTRRYQSSHAIDGQSGYGWVSSLSARLHYAVFLKAAPSTYSKEADIRMPDGALYRFVENADGSYTPPEGRFDTLIRNGDGTWDLWLQRTSSHYHFDATGNLTEMVDDFGNTLTLTYASDRLQRIEDSSGSGRYVDITYGGDGRISDVTDNSSRNIHYAYNASGTMTAATNAANQSTAYSYVNGKYVPLLNSVTDPWGRNITTVIYDAQDRVRSYTDRGETYTYTYNYNGVSTTTAKADSSGNTWVYPFGGSGLVTDSIPPGGGAAEHVDYYSSGLVQMRTDPTGVKTYYVYNALGNPTSVTWDYQGATAVRWDYVYDPNFPQKVLTVTPRNPSTNAIHPHWQGQKFDYYPAGSAAPGALHHVYRVQDDGVTAAVVRTYTYDSHGRVLTDADAGGNVKTFTYDSNGNVVTATFPANNDAGTLPVVSYAYDAVGRPISETDSAGKVVNYTWDALDRIKTVTPPPPSASSTLTFTTTYFYDEYDASSALLVTRIVDPNGKTWRLGFDQYRDLVRVTDDAGGVTRFNRVKGLVTSRVDPNNYTVTYAYDALRRLSTVTYADGTFERYTYNADNTVATKRDRANQTIALGYDRHKRVISKTYPNGGVITATYQGQKVVSVSDTFASPSETHTVVYDNLFRMISFTQGARGTVSYTWTADDHRATQSVSGGATTTYGYYPDGSLRTLAWSPVSGNFKYDYTITGRTQTITFPNGQTRSFGYDDQGRTTSVANTHPTAGSLASFAYAYDIDAFTAQPTMLGLRTTTTTTIPALGLSSAVSKFGYDNLKQLTRTDDPSASPYSGASTTWTYDAMGNRTATTVNGSTTSSTYNKFGGNSLNSQQLQSDGSTSYTYDANGSRTAKSGPSGSFTFSYDYEHRLRSVAGSATAGYAYDFLGRRTVRTVSGATTNYLYSAFEAIAETGASSAEYLFGNGIDQPLAMLRGGTVYYYDVDVLGSVVAINDASGTVNNSYAYDSWGVFKARNETVTNPFGFTGRENSEAGYQYNRHRYYEPSSGTFASVDPLSVLAAELYGQKLRSLPTPFAEYQYADNRPTMATDPFGLAKDPAKCRECNETLRQSLFACLKSLTEGQLACVAVAAGCALVTGPALVLCLLGLAACEAIVWEQYLTCQYSAEAVYRECVKTYCNC